MMNLENNGKGKSNFLGIRTKETNAPGLSLVEFYRLQNETYLWYTRTQSICISEVSAKFEELAFGGKNTPPTAVLSTI